VSPEQIELVYELSPMQQAMLFHTLYAPGSGVYVLQMSLRVTGRLDVAAFERAWQHVVDRQAILRTAFFWEDLEKPLQVVHRSIELRVTRESWRDLDPAEQRVRLERWLEDDREQGFDLSEAPLMRLALIELDEDTHQLVWTLHHLLVDGWSQGRLLRELFTCYAAFAAGREPLLEPPGRFRDYIAWLQRQDLGEAESFWRQSLAGFTSPTLLAPPNGTPGRNGTSFREARRRDLRLSPQTSAALREVARRHRLTLNTLVQGAWALLLAQETGREDVVFGTTVAGRPAELPGVESIVGLFINTLPLRAAVRPEQRLPDWLAGLQQRQVEARRYEHAPLVEVQRWSELPAGTPLFDHLLVFENLALPAELSRPVPGLEIADEGSHELTNYALSLIVIPGTELTLSVRFDAGHFDAPAAARIVERLAGLLTAIAEDGARPVADLPLLLPAERHQVLIEWGGTGDEASAEPIHARFEAQARRTPEAPAVTCQGASLTYAELERRANQLARHLRSLGVVPEHPVGLCCERSLDLLVGILGILKSGGAYLPLDPYAPRERLAYMIEDAGVRVVVGMREPMARLATEEIEAVLLDAHRDLLEALPGGSLPPLADGSSLAYVIYTSGSTGRPKGSLVTHGNVVRLFDATHAWFGFDARDVWSLFHSYAFDFSVWEIWGALLYGGRVVVVPHEVSRSPELFLDLLAAERVTVLNQTPSAFAQLARVDAERGGAATDLRLVIFGGEALDVGGLAPWFDRHGDERPRLVNMYGITETTVHVTYRPLRWEDAGGERRSVIGVRLPDLGLYVLDAGLQPVPIGVAGELVVGGAGLARGYLGRPDLTASRFVPDPFSGRPGARLYRSGDLARFLPDGDLEYLGRIDHQVKIRGFRIELGEIEAVLGSHPAVRECAVLVRDDVAGSRALVAYVTGDAPPSSRELRAFVAERLPDYMVPAFFVPLAAFPLTVNGKLDRRALPAPERGGSEEDFGAPADPVEELLAGVWAGVLGLERVGVRDDFFALGGHSLLATQVVSRIRGVLGVDLPLRALFESPTVAGLAEAVRQSRQGAAAPPIVPVPRDGRALPLSFAQQRLWLIDQLEPGNPAYNIPTAVLLRGEVSAARLERIFAEIVRRHEALRTTFGVCDGQPVQPVQIIAPALPPELAVFDLTGLPRAGREERALALGRELAGRPFDLRRGPLLRLGLVRLDERLHLLVVTLHHIVSDGWSMGVLLREIAALAGDDATLPELPVQYADFAVWQRDWLQGGVIAAQLGWWRQELADAPGELALPVDRPRGPLQSREGALVPVALPAGLAAEIRQTSRAEGVTPFMLLAAAFQTLLHRMSGQDDVLVGTPVAGRDRLETEGLIGFFVETLVLRGRLGAPELTVRALLEQTRETVLGAFEHQELPFERLVEELVPERNLAISPLFQVLFTLQTAAPKPVSLPGLTLEPVVVYSGQAQLDLSLELAEAGDALRGVLEISRALFDTVTGQRLAESFVHLLQAAVADPEARIATLPLLGAAERHQVLREWNEGGGLADGDSIVALFERQAALAPDAPALSHEGQRLTYGELDREASRLAARLRRQGVGPETPVAVVAERNPELIVSFLGILKAGGAYVPLDPAYPEERRAFMLADSGAVALEKEDKDGKDTRDDKDRIPEAEQLAYVLYTSGSTGRPKGVMVSHGALARYVEAVRPVYGIGPADRVLQFCSTSFDTSLEEIVPCLTSGAELVLRTDAMLGSVAAFLASCESQGITVLSLPTAYWHEIAAKIESEGLAVPSNLRLVVLGGERALPERVAAWRAAGGPRLVNTYGVTESTIVSTATDLALPSSAETRGQVSIGRAIGGTEVLLFDRGLEPAPAGAAGELYLGGGLLARGYLGRPDLTAERFVPHPYAPDPGARLYRTGDLARAAHDGALEYVGRADRQVKIRGYRIEIPEIEARLLGHPGIEAAVVLLREDQPGEKVLAAYVVPRPGSDPAPAALRAFLRETLPDYMVPGAWVALAALPLTPNGKLDRRALPAPEGLSPVDDGPAAPSDPVEELLAGIWSDVLGRGPGQRVGVRDDFFVLGGHSLLATQVVSRVRTVFGVELPLRQMFESPTVAELARAVRALRQEGTELPFARFSRDRDLPLSFAQQRLWLVDRLDPGNPAYNVPTAVRLTGAVSPALLERTFGEIVRRHEALRTMFAEREGQPVQVIAPELAIGLPVLDLTGLPEVEREAEARALAAAEARLPFDLRRGPLLCLALLRLEEREHVLLVTLHHIVSDGWSTGVLMREIAVLSAAFAEGRPSPLPELPVQYADFALWQRGWLQGEVLDAQLAAWTRRLAGAPQVLELPTDRPRPAVQTSRGAARFLDLSPALAAAARALCRREGVTLFMTLLAAWTSLLGRLAGQDDLLAGTPIAGRNRLETEGLIGFFVNTLVLRADLSGTPAFGEVLARTRETVLDGFAHQDLPFERLVEELVPQRDLSRSPLFQVMFALQTAAAAAWEIPGLAMRPLELPVEIAKFDLSLSLSDGPAGLLGMLEHNTDLFDGTTVERLGTRFVALLEAVTRDPGITVAALPLLLAGERQQVLVELSDTRADFPRGASLPERFAAVAEAMPDALAVIGEDGEEHSYRRLDEASTHLARHLAAQGVGPGARVGVAMQRSADLVVALLAILKAGAAYVPLDPGYPEERLRFVREDAGVEVVLRDADAAPSTALLPRRIPPEALAYVIYTSGSTGQPKGVAVPHRAVLRLVTGTDALQLRPGDRLAFNANTSFDAATYEIWGALLHGATLVVISQDLLLSPRDLAEHLRRHEVTVLHLTTALFNRVVRETPEIFPPLRCALFGGEASDPAAVALALSGARAGRLLHTYGPTESTTFATFHEVTDLAPGAATVPIGRPLANTTAYLLDGSGEPAPLGHPGELVLGGDGLAWGYLNRPELTAERFLPDPFGGPGGRLYRTGDLVRRRADGALEFQGRIDHQVKIRGFRIELGEIETVLRNHPAVRECLVAVRREALVAWVILDPTDPSDPRSAIAAWLREKLPDYMVPSAFVVLDAFPLTPNGKVDRKALPAPKSVRSGEGDPTATPGDVVEELLAAIWAQVLERDRVGVHDDFFALGGHSLLAVQAVSRIRDVLGLEIPLRQLFEHPTVADLARAMRSADPESAPALQLATGAHEGDPPLSFAQQRLWLLDRLEPGTATYNLPSALRLTGELSVEALERTFTEVVRRHAALRTTFALAAGHPVQVIADPRPLELRVLDLSGAAEDEREEWARQLALEEARRPFDLQRGPLLRLGLLRLDAREHLLLLTLHHIISDGWSMGVLLREIAALYPAFLRGEPSPLPELALQYADFAVWQRGWLQGAVLEAQLDFWRRQLAGAPQVLELSTDRPRPAAQTFHGAIRPVVLTPELSEAVLGLCRREGVTPFMGLLAAWAVLLGRHANQEDVLVGVPVAGRSRKETEELIGFFVNTLVLRSDLSGNPPFTGLLSRVRRAALDAFTHQDLPFDRIVEEVVAERNRAVSPLFQILFALQNAPQGTLATPGLVFSTVDVDPGVAKFDLSLSLSEGPEGFFGGLEHNTDLFDGSTAERLLARFTALLESAVAWPELPLAELPLFLEAERQQVLVEPNEPRHAAPHETTIPALFAASVARSPEAPAVVFAGEPAETLSYAELDERSAHWAQTLRRLGVGPEVRVGLCVRRSPRMLVGLLAVLRAGGAYVPLDPAWPAERLAWMLDDAGVDLVLAEEATAQRVPGSRRILFLDGLSPTVETPRGASPSEAPAAPHGFPETNGAAAGDAPRGVSTVGGTSSGVPEPLPFPDPSQAAYVIYTSGSTGRPKGVVALHGGLAAFSQALAGVLDLHAGDRVLQFASLSFDASAVALYPPLIRGAAVVLHPDPASLTPWELVALCESQRLTAVELPAALWRVTAREAEAAGLRFGPAVRRFMTGGESLLPEALRQWGRTVDPEARLLSSYGPTEATVVATVYLADGREAMGAAEAGSQLGRALPGTGVYLLDRQLTPVPLDVPGEIYLGGAGVTRGYLGRPDATAAVFLPDPWGLPGSRLYRTGDRARRRPDGSLEFLGRIDHQVKIRGFRIEPGEIEAVLGEHSAVRDCVVLARKDALIAWVLLDPTDPSNPTDPSDLIAWLSEKLPAHMVPAVIVPLDAFPLAPTGKVDREALPDPERRTGETAYVAPSDPLERMLAGVWSELLRLDRIGPHDNFFTLGGHSLLATQLVSRLRTELDVEVPLRWVFEAPTIAQLARVLRDAGLGGVTAPPPLLPVPRDRDLPLSFAQQRLWLLDQIEPESSAYNISLALRLTGAVAPALLERVFAEIVRRHEALRTTFAASSTSDGEPVQVIAPEAAPALPLVDLAHLPEANREAQASALARDESRRPFDLRRGPLLRLALVRLAEREHLLLLALHHIVADGWSMGVLLREIGALHEAFSAGRPSPLPELPVQYADFAVWQRSWLQGEALEAQLDFWKRQLAGAPQVLELPTDRPRPDVQTSHGAVHPAALSSALSEAVLGLCHRQEVTPFMALWSAWAVLLARHAGQDDVLIGSPSAGRSRGEIEGLIGFFVNTLVLRSDLTGTPTFAEVLDRARRTALDAFAHQDLPFERIVEEVATERHLAISPLFQSLFALQSAPQEELATPGLTFSAVEVDAGVVKFDLSLTLSEGPSGFSGALEHNTDLFDASTAGRLLDRFAALLEVAVAQPDLPISELPLFPEAESRQVLVEPNQPRLAAPRETTIPALFAAAVARSPEAPAVIFAGEPAETLSYAELDESSARWALTLRRLGIGPEVRVGLCVRRSPRMLVGLLAVLRAGGAYVPLDPTWPAERLAWMLDDAGVALVLAETSTADSVPGARNLLLLDGLPPTVETPRGASPPEAPGTPHGFPKTNGAAAGDAPRGVSTVGPDPSQAAYVIYTSGSTGRPKGVVAHHGGLAAFSQALAGVLELHSGDRVLQFASLSFDASAVALYPPLISGATVVLHPDPAALSPWELVALCEAQRLTAIELPAALWRLMSREAEAAGLRFGRAVRRFMTGGESLLPEALRQWGRIVDPQARLLSSYGPTETTVVSTVYLSDGWEAAQATFTGAPLGRALPGTGVYLLDARLAPVPLDVPGEIFLGGAGVTRGYLGRPDLTAAAFLPDPWGPPGARLYRTGDRARRRPDGSLEFLGRVDHQVKIRGFRIEPGEIEATLDSHPAVRDCIVLAREGVDGPRLVAWILFNPSDRTDPTDSQFALTAWLREKLPEHMVPSAILPLDAFPLAPTGKVDRKALPDPERSGDETAYVAPRDPLEEMLAEIWSEVLHVGRVGLRDNFFALGGHSLLATQVVTRIRKTLGIDVPLRRFFEAPTLAQLARVVHDADPDATPPAPPIVRVPRESPLPLSFGQQRLWLVDQIDPGSPAYNIPLALRLSGDAEPALLERIFAEIVRRHEVLRTTFASYAGEPVQVIAEAAATALPFLDLSHLPAEEREEQAHRLAEEETRRPFDLQRGPLLRLALVRLAPSGHLLLLTLHHIVADGWSMGVLLREIAALHQAYSHGKPSPLPELPVQYADFAVWQRGWLQGDVLAAELDVWKRRLAGAPQVLELPLDRPRPAVQTFRGARSPVALSPALSEAVHGLCSEQGVTPFMALLAAWAVVLGRHAGQDDLLVGSPIAGRNHPEIEPLIGFFVNTLVLRANLAGAPPFRELLARMRAEALEAFHHQDLPFERLVEELAPERTLARSPLFQVLFALQNAPAGDVTLQGLSLEPLAVESGVAKFDLTLTLGAEPNGFSGALEHNTDLFDTATAERLAARFTVLLEGAVAAPGTALSDLPLLLAAELDQVLREANATATDYPREASLPALFAAKARELPDAPAIVSMDGDVWSYRRLNEASDRLARDLQSLGVGLETPVGLSLERSPELILGTLAILKAGGVYVPLDATYPDERLAFMLEDTGARIVLVHERTRERIEALEGRLRRDPHPLAPSPTRTHTHPGEGEPCFELVDVGLWAGAPPLPGGRECVWERGSGGEGREGELSVEMEVPATCLAYIIYTSGSTGRPKGVAVPHRAVVRLVRETNFAHLGPGDRTGQVANSSFDAATYEIWGALLTGAAVVVIPREVVLSPSLFADTLREHQVTSMFLTSALFTRMAREVPGAFAGMSELLVGGEAVDPVAARTVLAAQPPRRLLNGYGPTESTTFAAWHHIQEVPEGAASIPIGRPLANTTLYVLDRWFAPVPPGAVGELCIGGDGLARGYLGRPELTAERFAPHPFETGERLYRTGDLVRLRSDSALELLGRIDHQIKLRGFRIELGEIEATLASHPAVRECAAAVRGDLLAAYVVLQPGSDLQNPSAAFRAYLAERLPDFMVPATYVLLDALPLSANGKLDRKALPDPERAAGPERLGPRDALELQLVQIWEEVLNVHPIGVRDDFFAAGGHSLLAVQVTARIESRLGRTLPLAALLRHPTIERLAALLREDATPLLRTPLVELAPGAGTPLFLVHPVGGEILCYVPLARRLDRPVYGLQSTEEALSLEEMATLYLRHVREVQPAGPYLLGGWSLGGAVAFEMARQLEAQGETVERLVLIDSYAPGPLWQQDLDDRALVAMFADDLAQLLGIGGRALPEGLGEDAISWLAARAEEEGLMPPGLGVAELQRRFATFAANFRAMAGYVGGSCTAPLLLVRASQSSGDADGGWGRVAGQGVEIREIAGDHYTLLQEPTVESLATLLQEQGRQR